MSFSLKGGGEYNEKISNTIFAEILLAYGLSREEPDGRNIWLEVRLF